MPVPVQGLMDLWLKSTGQRDKKEIQQRRGVPRRKDNQDARAHPHTVYFESPPRNLRQFPHSGNYDVNSSGLRVH